MEKTKVCPDRQTQLEIFDLEIINDLDLVIRVKIVSMT